MNKKLLSIILATFIMIPVFGICDKQIIHADGSFEVAYINDDCSFETVDSYSSFNDAKNRMIELGGDDGDYVVLSNNSLSPMKVVAMNSGIAYSYPYRANSKIITIYGKLSDSKLSGLSDAEHTYVAANNEMQYLDTYVLYSAGQHGMGYDHGYVKVNLRGFIGYTDLEYVDLVPTKLIKAETQVSLGGNSAGSYSVSKPQFSVDLEQNYYIVEQNGNYKDLVLVQHYIAKYTEKTQRIEKNHIGVAPSFMQEGNKYYSFDGVNFYSDRRCKNLVGTYFNYYQFVPARTITNIKTSTITNYINNGADGYGALIDTGSDFVNAQNKYGFNAALCASIGIHESAWGHSELALYNNNLFGIAAYDNNVGAANSFSSVKNCIEAEMGDVLANYMDPTCGWYFSMSLGNKAGGFITSYASDPYWPEEISQYYYAMDKANNNNNGNLSDFNSVKLALVKENTAIKKGPTNNSVNLYNTQNKYGYQQNLIVPVLDKQSAFAKIQLPTPIIDGEVVYATSLSKGTNLEYDMGSSVGYIATDKLIPLNFSFDDFKEADSDEIGNITPIIDISTINPDNLNPLASVSKFEINGNILSLAGTGLLEGINFDDISKISHKLVLKDLLDNSKEYVFSLNTKEMSISLGDGHSYKYIGYEGNADIKDVPLGSYAVYLRISDYGFVKDTVIKSSNNKYYNKLSTIQDGDLKVVNRLSTNEKYAYRFELEIMSSPFDYSKINKPTMNRTSLFNYINTLIDENADLTINGYSMIYYLNYNDANAVKYEAYLVKDSKDYKKLDTSLKACPYDYASLLGSEYNMDNICFEAKGNIADLSGEYKMYLKITNTVNGTDYIDYIEMIKSNENGLSGITIGEKNYRIVKTEVRNRTVLTIN